MINSLKLSERKIKKLQSHLPKGSIIMGAFKPVDDNYKKISVVYSYQGKLNRAQLTCHFTGHEDY